LASSSPAGVRITLPSFKGVITGDFEFSERHHHRLQGIIHDKQAQKSSLASRMNATDLFGKSPESSAP
jgi:hypothetical protein